MKIIQIEAIPILVPLKAGLTTKTAHGEHIDSPYVIVRVHTDEGLIGLGEATLAPRWSGETNRAFHFAVSRRSDGSETAPPFPCLQFRRRFLHLFYNFPTAVSTALTPHSQQYAWGLANVCPCGLARGFSW